MGLIRLQSSNLPSGSVLQVKQTVITSQYILGSSYADVTGFSVDITPNSTSSKILIQVDLQGRINNGEGWGLRLYRGSTLIHDPTPDTGGPPYFVYNNGGATIHTSGAFSYLDSPSSTSTLTYKIQGRCRGSGIAKIVSDGTDNTGASSITVMEIAG
jgi:hypothetical protein